MAFFRVSLKNGKRWTAKEHCDYINREGHYSSGEKAKELVAKGTVNLPAWAASAKDFFCMADLYERKRGSAYKSLEIALPCELTRRQTIALFEKILQLICKNKVAAWAIHSKQAETANAEQIHAHIMVSERMVTDSPEYMKEPEKFFKRYNKDNPELGGYKKDRRFAVWGNKDLKELREKIAELINEAYNKAGISIRVSAKSLDEQREEAVKKNDIEMIEFLDRQKAKYIPYFKFKQFQKSIEQSGLMDRSELIPMIPLLGSEGYQDLIEQNLGIDNFLLERTGIQIKKYKLLRQQADQDEKAIGVLLKNFGGCNIDKLRVPMAELKENIRLRFDANQKFIKLVNLVYNTDGGNKIAISLATRGLSKKIVKAKQRLRILEDKKRGLVMIKKYFPGHDINLQIDEQKKLIKVLSDKYNTVRNLPETLKRLEHALQNINHKAEQRMEKYAIRKEENCCLQEICQELPALLKVANTSNQIVFSKKAEELIYKMSEIGDVKLLHEKFQDLKRQFMLFANSEIAQLERTEQKGNQINELGKNKSIGRL